jgi:hypothetical protein
MATRRWPSNATRLRGYHAPLKGFDFLGSEVAGDPTNFVEFAQDLIELGVILGLHGVVFCIGK